jgi:hypothetical protein
MKAQFRVKIFLSDEKPLSSRHSNTLAKKMHKVTKMTTFLLEFI